MRRSIGAIMIRVNYLSALIGVLAIFLSACSATIPSENAEPAEIASTGDTEPVVVEAKVSRLDEVPLIKGPVSPDGVHLIFGTPDLGLGTQRIGVVAVSEKGLVRSPAATISTFYYPTEGAEGELKQTTLGIFRGFPLNTRGMYTADLEFDKTGRWGLEISVLDENARTLKASLEFEVAETTVAPSAGSPAIRSVNKTLTDGGTLADLTTGSLQDPDLYRITIAEAVESGLPTVVVMASPAFCTNAVCGPQVGVLQELKDKYSGQANFIHVDLYDNPTGIQGDLSQAVISPTVIEWNLPSTEWSFVIDSEGIVSARFESFATFEELEEALLDLL